MTGKGNIRVPPRPPKKPPAHPVHPGDRPPLIMLVIALREFVEVATEGLQILIDEYNEDHKK